MYGLDVDVTAWINGLAGRDGSIDTLMIWVSAVGVPAMVLLTALQWWSRADQAATRHVIVSAGLSFLLGLALNQIVLLFVHRARPYDAGVTQLLISRSADFSFPSDHATASAAIAALFLLHGLRMRGVALMAFSALIAFSRIFVGTHYAADVLGGFATGVAAAVIVRIGYRRGTQLDRFLISIL